MPFGGEEFPNLASPLQSPVFCSTSSCQTINTILPLLSPISPTATHTVSDSRVPKMVQKQFNCSTLRLVQAAVYLWSHCVPSPGYLRGQLSCRASLRDTSLESSILLRAYTLYASDFHHPFLWITLPDIPPPTAKRDAPPILSECSAKSSGSCPDSATTSRNARSACS